MVRALALGQHFQALNILFKSISLFVQKLYRYRIACGFDTILLFAFIWRREKTHKWKTARVWWRTHTHTRLNTPIIQNEFPIFIQLTTHAMNVWALAKKSVARERSANDLHCFGKWGDIVWPGNSWISLFVMFDRFTASSQFASVRLVAEMRGYLVRRNNLYA